MVVDESGACIDGATIEVVGGQSAGVSVPQTTPCDVWDADGGVYFKESSPGRCDDASCDRAGLDASGEISRSIARGSSRRSSFSRPGLVQTEAIEYQNSGSEDEHAMKSAPSLKLIVCLVGWALPVSAQEAFRETTQGPMTRAAVSEAVRLALTQQNPPTAPSSKAGGLLSECASREVAKLAAASSRQKHASKRMVWTGVAVAGTGVALAGIAFHEANVPMSGIDGAWLRRKREWRAACGRGCRNSRRIDFSGCRRAPDPCRPDRGSACGHDYASSELLSIRPDLIVSRRRT